MKQLRISAVLAAAALLLVACNRDAEVTVNNPLLAYVPADTPYLYANLEATPEDVIDAFAMRVQPSLDAAQTLLSDLRIEISADAGDENREARLASAIMAELDGKLNRAGLESLGLSMESYATIYGMGVFPVMRVTLAKPDALREAIARVERDSGVPFTTHQLDGREYWRLAKGDGGPAVYFAILEDHFAMSLFPRAAEEDWLPAFLGTEMPEASTAAEQLVALNAEKNFTGFGSGFADLRRLASEFFEADRPTARLLADLGHTQATELDAVCKSEIRGIIDRAPRMVAGTTELSANRIGISYQLELEEELAAQMRELVADVPVADRNPDKVLTASLGLNVGRLRDFLKTQFGAIAESPYQCQHLQHLNTQATTVLQQLNQPMPPFINNLKGFRVSLDAFDAANFGPDTARGLFSLEMEKPQMVIGMLQMMVPGMGELNLEAGADPVALPEELLSFSNGEMQLYAAMGKDNIGVALGESKQSDLAEFMQADADNDRVFFSVEYDMAAQLDMQERIQQGIGAAGDGHAGYNDLARTMQEAYKAWLGRSRVEVSFDKDGIRADNTMTFK
ncbi:MAG: hypothetical protein HKN58_05550 [Xanthomonadales bacterium]|nr:hypothetical protein [Xanthomonadales bacterium]